MDASATRVEALGSFGALMLDAGYAVTDVAQAVRDTAATGPDRPEDVVVGVLPQAVLLDSSGEVGARLVPATGATLTFDQVGRTGRLVADAQRGRLTWEQLAQRVAAVRAETRLRPVWVVLLGSGFMSCGVSVVFGARWWSLCAEAVLGVVVGACIVGASRRLRVAQLLPYLCAVLVTVLLLLAADLAGAGRVPLFAVCAPLVVLIPGAIVTNAVIELSAGDVVSGGGRLISGLVVWGLLAAGIASGTALLGAQISGDAIVVGGIGGLSGIDGIAGGAGDAGGVAGIAAGADAGWWGAPVPAALAWPATALVAVGVGLFGSASARLTGVIVAELLLTYAVFVGLEARLGIVAATGIAAGVVLAASRALEAVAPDYPTVVVFRPAYWLLVPGSFGLVALTAVGAGDAVRATVAIVLALTVGTQVGAIVAEGSAALLRAARGSRGGGRA